MLHEYSKNIDAEYYLRYFTVSHWSRVLTIVKKYLSTNTIVKKYGELKYLGTHSACPKSHVLQTAPANLRYLTRWPRDPSCSYPHLAHPPAPAPPLPELSPASCPTDFAGCCTIGLRWQYSPETHYLLDYAYSANGIRCPIQPSRKATRRTRAEVTTKPRRL